jgi:hypothetical protein
MTSCMSGSRNVAFAVVAMLALPATAAVVNTSILLTGAFDGATPVSVNPSQIPIDKPLDLKFTVYGKLTGSPYDYGISLFLLDVTGVNAGLATVSGNAVDPVYGSPAAPIWDTFMAINGPLAGVFGFVGPGLPSVAFKQQLGIGGPADRPGYGAPLLEFTLHSQQALGEMTLRVAPTGGQDGFAYLNNLGTSVWTVGTDQVIYGSLDVKFTPEPATLILLAVGGLAARRRR